MGLLLFQEFGVLVAFGLLHSRSLGCLHFLEFGSAAFSGVWVCCVSRSSAFRLLLVCCVFGVWFACISRSLGLLHFQEFGFAGIFRSLAFGVWV